MQRDPIHVVLLSGGSGTRLWPLSNAARSKQFLKVLRDDKGVPESMVQRTTRCVREQCPEAKVTIATSAAQVEELEYQLADDFELSLEPERRDTAPAIMLAAAHVAWEQGASPDATVVAMPIDTYADPAYYQSIRQLDEAVQARVAELVLLGVEPTRPSSKFGYIVPKPAADGENTAQGAGAGADVGACPVDRFVEKPDHALASELIGQGALWNCGVFAFRLDYLLDIVRSYSDAAGYASLRARYAELPRNSFDYEVVERASSVAVIRYAGAWKDLGTWGSLCEELSEETAGKVLVDAETSQGVHVVNELDVPVVVAGVDDVAVAVTSDGVLVAGKGADARVRDLVGQAALPEPMCGRRGWGTYRVLGMAATTRDGLGYQTRELRIRAGEELCGVRCVTTWTVVGGQGELTDGGTTRILRAGDVARLESGTDFVLRATSQMRVIEVRCGVAGDD